MDFSIKTLSQTQTINNIKTDCIVIGVFEDHQLSQQAKTITQHDGIQKALKSGDISGKPGSYLLLHQLNDINASRVLLIGLGKQANKICDKSFKEAIQTATNVLSKLNAHDITFALPFNDIDQRPLDWSLRTTVLTLRQSIYRCDQLKSKKNSAANPIKKVTCIVDAAVQNTAKQILDQSIALANGIDLTKELGDLPANYCTPTYLAKVANELAQTYPLKVEILERKQLQALKMGSFLSVTNGSDQAPRFIVIQHLHGKAKQAPIVLVGKGITFDSGGISLKPGAGMEEMKYDMCGAASVLGTIRAIAEMGVKLNVIGIIPSCENMPSGGATKPGDIVTSMSGQTIEILNTDAEGRLILCDALSYAERFNPDVVIDIATLTGACVVALGNHNTGLFTRHDAAHDALADELLTAGKATDDTAWRMPIEERYQEQLKSNFADMANIGTPGGGSITAACFLEHFTKKYTWAHLDIAGTAWKSGAAKGASGRPVSLLTQFLLTREKQ